MPIHRASALAVLLFLAPLAVAKPKDKLPFPQYILRAHSVAVVVDPSAGISIDDPRANQVAQKDVETALANWGRFMPVLSSSQADLIIVIRKGSGKLANATISDPRQNNRAGVINPTDNGVSMGAQRGTQPGLSNNPPVPGGAGPGAEIGNAEDSFFVYEGNRENPLDGVPGWRYVAEDGLRAHNVPAVDRFKKSIEEAEKTAAKQAPQKQPSTPAASNP
jgi:hypothetical protein